MTLMVHHTICTIDFYSPTFRELRSVPFNSVLARFYDQPGVPASAVLDFVFDELLNRHQGTLYNFDGQPIDLFIENRHGDTILDRLWGVSPDRFITRYRDRARRPCRNRLKLTVIDAVLMLHFARRSFETRTRLNSLVIEI